VFLQSDSLDGRPEADKVGLPRSIIRGREGRSNEKAEVFPGRLRTFFGGRMAAISGAGESPRERLSVGTDHPDSDEHNTRGAG